MVTVVISPVNVVNFPDGGGHFWVYMQYVQGLHQLGCEVYWLERFCSSGDQGYDASVLSTFAKRMERYGLAGKLMLYFDYRIDAILLSCFRRTAVVDIDPGLLQFWMATRQLLVPLHDVYITTGETVGTPSALFPDCGRLWFHIRPPICLERWPYVHDPRCEAFTTVSSWWGDEWITDGTEVYENNKRVPFLEFTELPGRTSQQLELALFFGDGDAQDLRVLASHGWRVRHSLEVARTPERYHAYIQGSRGEFSCAKPSCMKFQNAWISDRTLCYLASGKPVVVQNTGPSAFLPNGEGMFRFATLEEAVRALE